MDARREQLLGRIDRTNRLQKRLAIVYGVLGVLAFVMFFIDGLTGALITLTFMLFAISSFWITAGSNAANRRRLDDLLRQRDIGNAAV
jgi:hypothetical protein